MTRAWLLLLMSACGGASAVEQNPEVAAQPTQPAAKLAAYGVEHVGLELPGEDVCEKNEDGTFKEPIEPGTYQGILRNARCDQQKWLTMANITYALGVTCRHCHVPHPTDPKKELYHLTTDAKTTANWMYRTFVQGLRPTDGTKTMCTSCHTDRATDKAVAKILRDPRDRDYAQEWMHEVMTAQFVEANSKRLKCKTCHGAMAPDQPGWLRDVVGELSYDGAIERSK